MSVPVRVTFLIRIVFLISGFEPELSGKILSFLNADVFFVITKNCNKKQLKLHIL